MPCFLAIIGNSSFFNPSIFRSFQGIRAKKEWKCPETRVAEQVATTGACFTTKVQ
jgi:hypothetical protein